MDDHLLSSFIKSYITPFDTYLITNILVLKYDGHIKIIGF